MKQKFWSEVKENTPILDLKEHFKTQVESGELDDAFADWLWETEANDGIGDFFEHLVYMRGKLEDYYVGSVNDFVSECKRKLDEVMEDGEETTCSIYGRIYEIIEVDI